MSIEDYVGKRLEMIQKELDELRSLLSGDEGEIINLQGIWKGADITDEEIDRAKHSLFGHLK